MVGMDEEQSPLAPVWANNPAPDPAQVPPPGWRWSRVSPAPSEFVKESAHGVLHGDALVAADGTWLISADAGYAGLEVHPAAANLLAKAHVVARLRGLFADWEQFYEAETPVTQASALLQFSNALTHLRWAFNGDLDQPHDDQPVAVQLAADAHRREHGHGVETAVLDAFEDPTEGDQRTDGTALTAGDGNTNEPPVPELVSVVDVRVLARYVLELTFDTGEVRVIDFERLMWGPVLEPLLADYDLFLEVAIDTEAGTITWPATGADWSPEDLYAKSRPSVPRRAPQR